ncbi:MAG TPA: GlsB/YeaQ/YmgE family stress response membrane protein [Bryobacteraceae bacterium]|nr:GlsB/YeaQ/YmgE family stress response membrane protein [Bryobacteraceae bacterium]HPT28343.1 GlsB/YeaQ/YmgE family stress response membrane protein [Bryobacteraceae bacterium]
MMSFIWMCIIGLIAGAVAKLIMPGKDPGGMLVTMLLGIAGSLVAGYLGRAIGWYGEGQGAGFIMSVAGAIILLAVYRVIKSKQAAG